MLKKGSLEGREEGRMRRRKKVLRAGEQFKCLEAGRYLNVWSGDPSPFPHLLLLPVYPSPSPLFTPSPPPPTPPSPGGQGISEKCY